MNDLPEVKYNNVLVVTSSQVAKMYGTTNQIVSKDFNRNKSKFTYGKHYFKLTGEELKKFRGTQFCGRQNDYCKNLCSSNSPLQISNKTRVLYLWTNRGALLLAKIIDTDIAWEAYERLVDFYFEKKDEVTPLAQIPDIHSYAKPVFQTSSTKVPRNASWYERNRRRMNYLAQRSQRQTKDVYHHILKRLGEEFDLDAAKEIYTREKGYPPKYAMDVVSYFPELAELAEIHLGIMEKTTEKAIRDAKKARESREEMENQ